MTSPSLLNGSKTPKHDDLHLWLREKHIMWPIIQCAKFEPSEKSQDWSAFRQPDTVYDKDIGVGYRIKLVGWTVKLDEIRREVPVYSQNYKSKYLQGICDAIITYHIELDFCKEDWRMKKIYDEEAIKKYIDKNIEYNKKYPTMPQSKTTREDAIRYANIEYNWESEKMLKHYTELQKYGHSYEHEINNGYRGNGYTIYRLLIDFKPKLDSISGIIGQLKVYKDCIGPSDLMIITYDKNEKYDPILKDENIYILRIEESTGDIIYPSIQTTLSTATPTIEEENK